MKLLKKTITAFLILLISYCILLTISFSIPQQLIQENTDKSLSLIESESLYPIMNHGNSDGTKLDNFTDHLMIRKTSKKSDLNILENAMYVDNYPRYWHGYLIFLRPLLIIMNLGSIRLIYAVVLFLLIGLTTYHLIKRSDIYVGIAFLISLAVGNAATFFFSMQFSNLWIVTLLAMLLMLCKPKYIEKFQNMLIFFFMVGSLTNFFDLLTVPLISWGIPMITYYYINNKYPTSEKEDGEKPYERLIFTGVFWTIGYGLTWFTKWLLATIILRKNVIHDALTQILFRTEGNADYPLQRIEMLRKNVILMYPRVTILILGITCFIFLAIAIKKRSRTYRYTNLIRTFFLYSLMALAPYIWLNLLANHSQIHFWFTYRGQIITVFSILCGVASLIPPTPDDKKLNL